MSNDDILPLRSGGQILPVGHTRISKDEHYCCVQEDRAASWTDKHELGRHLSPSLLCSGDRAIPVGQTSMSKDDI